MTSVVSPQKEAPTSQQEGRFKEQLEGVVTLPLEEASRGPALAPSKGRPRRSVPTGRLPAAGAPARGAAFHPPTPVSPSPPASAG